MKVRSVSGTGCGVKSGGGAVCAGAEVVRGAQNEYEGEARRTGGGAGRWR